MRLQVDDALLAVGRRGKVVRRLHPRGSSVWFPMRYLVKARVKKGHESALMKAVQDGTLGRGSVAGDEYLHDMQMARVDGEGLAQWVEVCFCAEPLEEERPYWEQYFELLSIKDAHSRRNCRHENGTEPWACCGCDCTRKLEAQLQNRGEPLLTTLTAAETPFKNKAGEPIE